MYSLEFDKLKSSSSISFSIDLIWASNLRDTFLCIDDDSLSKANFSSTESCFDLSLDNLLFNSFNIRRKSGYILREANKRKLQDENIGKYKSIEAYLD